MKSERKAKLLEPPETFAPADHEICVRHCHGIAEFEACLQVERRVWKSLDIDVVPIPLFVVASETGGQVIGAFRHSELIGFTMAIPGWRHVRPFLHSHMTAVLEGYRDQGIGRKLKLFQREDALSRGISLVEWTFDPLVTRNAYFNFMRLGAIARRYLPNVYGITSSPLHGSLPTDRLVAEWHLKSARVSRVLSGKAADAGATQEAIRITLPSDADDLRNSDPAEAQELQSRLRAQFLELFAKGYATTAILRGEKSMHYVLEPWTRT